MTDPVVVIGASLAGMAAAARLAKAGHPVELWEESSVLGGRWAPYELPGTGLIVDDAPAVIGFPAPWRDLFRKSGRPFEAELTKFGYRLVPAAPGRVVFDDGSELDLPTDRGEQYAAMNTAYGSGPAGRWRDLLDRLDDVWQTRRPLGLERELDPQRLTRPVRDRLLHRRTVADLAVSLDHPQLSALVRSSAYRQGSVPERTPALAAVDLSVARTFGAWQIEPSRPGAEADTGRSSVLVEALTARLSLRKVVVRLDTAALQIVLRDGRVVAVRGPQGEQPAAAVISTLDPWRQARLLARGPVRERWRRVRQHPATAPAVTHRQGTEVVAGVSERMELSTDGIPVITFRRPVGDGNLTSVHDHAAGGPAPSAGLAFQGFRSWIRRPPVSTAVPGLYTAGPFSPAGPSASQTILSGALASYACHDRLAAQTG